jgi:hypothetical protein
VQLRDIEAEDPGDFNYPVHRFIYEDSNLPHFGGDLGDPARQPFGCDVTGAAGIKVEAGRSGSVFGRGQRVLQVR